jgi:hypothetical protein
LRFASNAAVRCHPSAGRDSEMDLILILLVAILVVVAI